jgi:hypothetical protein
MFKRCVAIKQTVMTRRYPLNSRGGEQGMLTAYVQTQATNRKSQFKREEASNLHFRNSDDIDSYKREHWK